jgi:DNA-directed RNA polymerase I and III subunit RPAC1
MAIEKCYIKKNSSVLADEILAHRLGLVPIFANPALFSRKEEDADDQDTNTIVFNLQAKCTINPKCPPNASDDESKYINSRGTADIQSFCSCF